MNLLVIEDDRKLNRMLCEILEKEGYTVKACTDGEEGAYYLQQNAYDLALVDWMLPGESGPDILRESRRKGIMTPVVMLTALTAVENKVTCLDAGADDYLTKPFDLDELQARIEVQRRHHAERAHAGTAASATDAGGYQRQAPIEELVVLRYGDLVYDTKALLLACGREEIAVSKKLGLMIELFMKSKGQALARATLFARVWGADADVEEAILDNYIGFFRRRLAQIHSKMSLRTVRGVGYALVEEKEGR